MRRKIACYITAAVTALFMVLRIITAVHPDLSLGILSLEDSMIAVTLVSMTIISVLCYSRSATLSDTNGVTRPFSGWIATFCGALLIMSVILDIFCWVIYGRVPPPGEHILNNVDRYSLIFSLIFGVAGGIFMILQGFHWMAGTAQNRTALSWLSITTVLWMWFRLARYEISYASTIDISHSFFDFAGLVTASLFFLQFARAVTGAGAKPKNSLLIFAMFTSMTFLSGAPLTFYRLSQGAPVSSLLISLVDATIGLLALVMAFVQVYTPAACEDASEDMLEDVPEDDAMAWTVPAKERKPLDPPFALDQKLPILDASPEKTETPASEAANTATPSVDDILAELNKDIY